MQLTCWLSPTHRWSSTPNFEVVESDFTNNAMKCNCKYDGHRIWVHNCHIGTWWEE